MEAKRKLALQYCQDEIDFYARVFAYNHDRWKWLQITTIIAGTVGTVLAGIESLSGWIRSTPIAIATIAAGLNSSFSYQKDAIRQGATSDVLNGEKVMFETGSAPYDDPNDAKNISKFIAAIRRVIEAEQGAWKSQIRTDDSHALRKGTTTNKRTQRDPGEHGVA